MILPATFIGKNKKLIYVTGVEPMLTSKPLIELFCKCWTNRKMRQGIFYLASVTAQREQWRRALGETVEFWDRWCPPQCIMGTQYRSIGRTHGHRDRSIWV